MIVQNTIKQNDEMNNMIDSDIMLNTITLQLTTAANEIVISLQEQFVNITDDHAIDEYNLAKGEFETFMTEHDEVMKDAEKGLKEHYEPLHEQVEANVLILFDLAENPTDGIFSIVEDRVADINVLPQQESQMSEHLDELYLLANSQPVLELIYDFRSTMGDGITFLNNYEINGNLHYKSLAAYIFDISESQNGWTTDEITNYEHLSTLLADLESEVPVNVDTVAKLAAIETLINSMEIELNKRIEYIATLHESQETLNVVVANLDDLAHDIEELVSGHITESRDQMDENFSSTITQAVVLLLITIGLSIFLTLLISNVTASPLKKLEKNVILMGEGDLRLKELGINSNDEVGNLTKNFEVMNIQLRELVTSIIQSSEGLAMSSEELLSAAEETSAASEEIASTSNSMSDGATHQAQIIAKVNEQLHDIDETINDIINKIKGNSSVVAQIALQTNILALNAGIEASRAGDYGRGFAVVAENVRRLSDESKQAGEKITMVADSIAETLELTFLSIREQIDSVASLSEETAASAEELAAAATEISSSLQEITASSQDLASMADNSRQKVSSFIV